MIPNPWIIITILVGWFSSCTGAYIWGYHNSENKAQVVALKKEVVEKAAVIEKLKQTTEANSKALAAYNVQLQVTEQSLNTLKTTLEKYDEERANNPPPDVCKFTPADVDGVFGK